MKTRVDVVERKNSRIWVVSIDPFFREEDSKYFHRERVSVYSQPEGEKWTPAQVSWYSIGAVEVDDAEAFAKAISIAVENGRKMDEAHGIVREETR